MAAANVRGHNAARSAQLSAWLQRPESGHPDLVILTETQTSLGDGGLGSAHTVHPTDKTTADRSLLDQINGYMYLGSEVAISTSDRNAFAVTTAAGIGFLVRKPLDQLVAVRRGDCVLNNGRLCWLTISLGPEVNLHIAGVYGVADHTASAVSNLWQRLCDDTLQLQGRNDGKNWVIWGGDFNATVNVNGLDPLGQRWRPDVHLLSPNAPGNALVRTMQSKNVHLAPINLTDLAKSTSLMTRQDSRTGYSATCIDFLFTDDAMTQRCSSVVVTPGISDHAIVVGFFYLPNLDAVWVSQVRRVFRRGPMPRYRVPETVQQQQQLVGTIEGHLHAVINRGDLLETVEGLDGQLQHAVVSALSSTLRKPRRLRSSGKRERGTVAWSTSARTILAGLLSARNQWWRAKNRGSTDAARGFSVLVRRLERQLSVQLRRDEQTRMYGPLRELYKVRHCRGEVHRRLQKLIHEPLASSSRGLPQECKGTTTTGQAVTARGRNEVLAMIADHFQPRQDPRPMLPVHENLLEELERLQLAVGDHDGDSIVPGDGLYNLAPTYGEIRQVACEMIRGKQSADPGYHGDVLLDLLCASEVFCRVFALLVGLIWTSICLPQRWRRLSTVALPKPGKTPDMLRMVEGWRPITTGISALKVLDVIVYRRLRDVTIAAGLIPANFYGFLPNRSTTDENLVFMQVLAVARQELKGDKFGAVLLDTKQAYDTVWLAGLELKLRRLDLPDHLIRMVMLLQTGFTTTVHGPSDGGLAGVLRAVMRGLRQGGITSPWLYLLFLLDLFQKIAALPQTARTTITVAHEEVNADGARTLSLVPQDASALGFADDVTTMGAAARLQRLADITSSHARVWRYEHSLSKTVLMWLRTPHQRAQARNALPAPAVHLTDAVGNRHAIPVVSDVRLLGTRHDDAGLQSLTLSSALTGFRMSVKALRTQGCFSSHQSISMAVQLVSAAWTTRIDGILTVLGVPTTASANALRKTHNAALRACVSAPRGANMAVLCLELGRVPCDLFCATRRVAYTVRLLLTPVVPDEFTSTLPETPRQFDDGRRLLAPLPAATNATHPARQALLAQLAFPGQFPDRTLGRQVLTDLQTLNVDTGSVIWCERANSAQEYRARVAGVKRTILQEAERQRDLAVLAKAWDVTNPGHSAHQLVQLCSGVRSDDGKVVRGVLLAAPLPYLALPLGDRTCAVLRVQLRTSTLPVGAYRIRFRGAGGGIAEQLCNLCDEDVPATTMHVFCTCPAVPMVGARRRELAAFQHELVRRRALPADAAAALVTSMRTDDDGMLALLGGTVPAWWDEPIRESLCGWRDERLSDGSVRRRRITVRGYGPTDLTPVVEVWPIRTAVDQIVLRLLGRLWTRVLAAEQKAARMDG